MRFKYLLFIIVLVSMVPAYAAAPVWKVTKADKQLFIGGTIHLLTQADYPLPAEFDKAYAQAAKVVLETDMQTLQSPEYQQKIMQGSMYADGRNLKTVLKPETFQVLEKYLRGRGVPVENLMKFKAGMAAMTITMIELQRLGLIGTGVDEFFSLKAVSDHKKLGKLETVDQQLEFLFAMGEGQEDDVIAYTLRDIEELPNIMQLIKRAWRKGDIRTLKETTLLPFKQDFPDVYESLLVGRNKAWLPHIEAMLQTKEIELILVGALHLIGEDGVLNQLAKRGYKIQQL